MRQDAQVENLPVQERTMTTIRLSWPWQDRVIQIGLDMSGEGPGVLLLPALSSISTRREMAPLAQKLSGGFRTIAVDWPGFGDQPRPPLDWTPDAYAAFLEFVMARTPSLHAI